jgi:hypothetical protein
VEFVVRARVDRFALPPALDLSPRLERLPAEITAVQSLDPMSPYHYLDASPLVGQRSYRGLCKRDRGSEGHDGLEASRRAQHSAVSRHAL